MLPTHSVHVAVIIDMFIGATPVQRVAQAATGRVGIKKRGGLLRPELLLLGVMAGYACSYSVMV